MSFNRITQGLLSFSAVVWGAIHMINRAFEQDYEGALIGLIAMVVGNILGILLDQMRGES